MGTPLTTGNDWTFELLEDYYLEIEKIAIEEFDLDFYPNQIEIIHSEQMLDAYASVGMPIMYPHWSFGQNFLTSQTHSQKGFMGLAYEIVINSNPCIAYLMEENSMTMQNLVMAHACIGHNVFFKNNYLFKQWTDADGIIDYLVYAKKFIMDCEDEYGPEEVEAVLDAAHSLMMFGVDKYKRPSKLSASEEKERSKERREWNRKWQREIWDVTVPHQKNGASNEEERFPKDSEENILRFIEKNAPRLEDWKREMVRIVRKIAQYFYPQRQTQVMNEGCASFFHYEIMKRLREKNLITQGHFLEFLQSHTGVVYQPSFDHPAYSGINPYALGFAMYQDIKRICMDPTDEDREWFDFAGNGDWLPTIKHAIEGFKDESFIMQFLSPKVIRDFHLFHIVDDDKDPKIEVAGIHNEQGYKNVREALSDQYNLGYKTPDLSVYNVDRWGDRSMTIHHRMVNRMPLQPDMTIEVLKHATTLWGYDVSLESRDPDLNEPSAIFSIRDGESLLDVFEHDTP